MYFFDLSVAFSRHVATVPVPPMACSRSPSRFQCTHTHKQRGALSRAGEMKSSPCVHHLRLDYCPSSLYLFFRTFSNGSGLSITSPPFWYIYLSARFRVIPDNISILSQNSTRLCFRDVIILAKDRVQLLARWVLTTKHSRPLFKFDAATFRKRRLFVRVIPVGRHNQINCPLDSWSEYCNRHTLPALPIHASCSKFDATTFRKRRLIVRVIPVGGITIRLIVFSWFLFWLL